MYTKLPSTPAQAAKEIAKLHPEMLDMIISHLLDRFGDIPLIGETTDETLQKVYTRHGALQVIKELKALFFPQGL